MNTERDYRKCMFKEYVYVQKRGIDPSTYDRVWSGHIDTDDVEKVCTIFNNSPKPDDYRGRVMSCSDVCQVIGKDGKSRFYYVDQDGFKEIQFNASLTMEAKEPEITVLACCPGATAEVISIPNTLKARQEFVGGYIEAAYPSSDPIAIIVNSAGKILGLPLNRALYDEDGQMIDIVCGNMLVVGITDGDFCSLQGDMLEKYMEKFKSPETFVRLGRQIVSVKMPDQQRKKEHKQKPLVCR